MSILRQTSVTGEKRLICIPVDGSPTSETAFQFYLNNVRKEGDELLVVYVIEPPSLPSFSLKSGFSLPTDEWHKIILENSKKANQMEEEMSLRSHQLNIYIDYRATSSKDPGDSIVEIATTAKASQIIMGTRGFSPLKRAILGSVSNYVLQNANIPVTVVPGPVPDKSANGAEGKGRKSSFSNFFKRQNSRQEKSDIVEVSETSEVSVDNGAKAE